MKTGKISGVDAIGITCPHCGGDCTSPRTGSLMITEDEYPTDGSGLVVKCVVCGKQCKAPAFPGALRRKAPRRRA